MSDSITILFHLAAMSEDEYRAANYPCDFLRPTDNDGVVGGIFSRWMTATSPLTGADYKIKGILYRSDQEHIRVAGYRVKINLPACCIGHNLLLANWVRQGCEIVMLLLKYWLLKRGCSRSGIKALSIHSATLESVTLTYLFRCASPADAHAARRELSSHAIALHNSKNRTKQLQRKPVFIVGTDAEATVYCMHRKYKIDAYVKDGPVAGSFSTFPSTEVERAIRDEASLYLRVEIQLSAAWLRENNFASVAAWRYVKNASPYRSGINLIRGYLRLDENFRIRKPKPDQLQSLFVDDREYLRWHFAGSNVREHPLLAQKAEHHYYLVQSRILKNTRIDISIPWDAQSKGLSQRLPGLLAVHGQYRPPKELKAHIFCRATVASAIIRLEELINAELSAEEIRKKTVVAPKILSPKRWGIELQLKANRRKQFSAGLREAPSCSSLHLAP